MNSFYKNNGYLTDSFLSKIHPFLTAKNAGKRIGIVLLTLLALLGAAFTDAQAQIGTEWTQQTAPSGNYNGVVYGNGVWVAVGRSGLVATSTDGKTWTQRTAAQTNRWLSVTYGNGVFVAVSNDGTNRVMTSPDGVTWTPRTAASANSWVSVAFGKGVFVAVAFASSNMIMTSTDGITWTTRTPPAGSTNFISVTYGDGLFVASNGGTKRVATSPDGITWTGRTAAEANAWQSVAFGNGLYVAVSNDGTNRVMTSPNGTTWTARSVPAMSWYGITYGNGQFVAVSNSGTDLVMTSPDGITWTTRSSPINANKVAYNEGLFVAVGSSGIMTSGEKLGESGTIFTQQTAPSGNYNGVVYGNGVWVAVGRSGLVATSTDGKTWTQRTAAQTNRWLSVTYGNGVFVAVSNDGTNRVMTSPDGVTWTPRTAASANSWVSVAFGKGVFVAVAFASSNMIMTSTDGITWTTRTPPAGSTNFISVTYGDGLFVASNGGTKRVATSPDGIAWTGRTAAEANAWQSVAFGNGLYVAVSNDGTNRVITSPNGTTWTARSVPAMSWYGVTYGNGLFVAVSNSGTDRVMTSPDGINWTTRSSPINANKVAYNEGLFVAVGSSGIMTSSPPSTPTLTTAAATSITTTSATLGGEVTADGGSNITERGIVYATTENPTTESTKVQIGTGLGEFSQDITGLTHSITYYVRAYAVNENGTAYGIQITFTTLAPPVPILTTTAATDITHISATLGGEVTDAAGLEVTERGVVYAKTANPTTADSIVVMGSGLGAFSSDVRYLDYGTDYYVRAYAISSNGTGYGNEITFRTLGSFFVRIQTPGGIIYSVEMEPADTIDNLKAKLLDLFGYDILTQQLSFNSVVLEDNRTLSDYSIVRNSLLVLEVVMTLDSSVPVANATNIEASTNIALTFSENMDASTVTSTNIVVRGQQSGVIAGTWSVSDAVATFNPTESLTAGEVIHVEISNAVKSSGGATVIEKAFSFTVSTSAKIDGEWISRSSAADNSWKSVAYGNGLFVAVSSFGSPNQIMTSPDGIEWTLRETTAINEIWNSVAYGNGRFVVVSGNMDNNRVMTSTDGINWTISASGINSQWLSLTYGNGLFVAVGSSGSGNRVMTSPDGLTWTSRSSAADNQWFSVTYGNGLFVAVANDGKKNSLMTSPDGINWATKVTPTAYLWSSVTYGNGLFVAVSEGGASNRVLTSTDGETWTPQLAAANFKWYSVTYGDGLFVAVSEDGTVMTSKDGKLWTSRAASVANAWSSVTYGNGLFVAVSSTGTGNRVMTMALNTADKVTESEWVSRSSAADNSWKSVAYGNGLFVAVSVFGSPNQVMTSPDGIEWTLRETTAINEIWNSIAYGNGRFVVVSGSRVMTSTDGINWTISASGINSQWSSLTYGNGLFVAVGISGSGNRVMTSPDGLTWTSRTSAADKQWFSVTYGNGLFVAVANDGKNNSLMTSPDGINWATKVTPTTYFWRSVTYGNGLFVAVSEGGASNRVLTSTDGETWTPQLAAANFKWQSVTYGAGLFVAVSEDGTVMASKDGKLWNSQTSAAMNAWSSVTYENGLFVAVSSTGTGNRVMTLTANILESLTLSGTFTASNKTYDGLASATVSAASLNLTGIANGDIVTLDSVKYAFTDAEAGSGKVVSITNAYLGGADASKYSVNLTDAPTSTAIIDKAPLTITAKSDSTIASSTPFSGGFGVTYSGFVASEDSTVLSGTLSYTGTSQGATAIGEYVITPAGLTSENYEITFVSGTLTLTAAPSGTEWVIRNSAADFGWHSVAYGNGIFVAVSPSSSGDRVMTSPDGITWTLRSASVNNDWRSVTFGNGLFVAVSENGSGNQVMTSPDGINWTTQNSPADNKWNAVTYGNGLFVAVAYSGNGNRVMTSPDGINWTIQNSAADNSWWAITYGNDLFVAVALDGNGNRVMTSPDGITWTSQNAAAANQWLSVTYGNGLFVAVTGEGTGNRVMISTDGITWTSQNAAAENSWRGVTYGNGLFVAVAQSGTGNRVMTSPDGINWTSRNSAADNQWISVTYANDIFVAVSWNGNGNRVMTSGTFVPELIPLTLSGSFTPNDKSYDGLTTATVSDASLTLNGVENGDVVTIDSVKYAFSTKDVGNGKTVSITNVYLGGVDSDKYSLNLANAPSDTASIFAKMVTISGSFTVSTKVYDGSDLATIVSDTLSISGAVQGETLSLFKVANFSNRFVGIDKEATLLNSTLEGTSSSNYQLSFDDAPVSRASITPATLTVGGNFSANNKIYDGTLVAELITNNLVLNGVLSEQNGIPGKVIADESQDVASLDDVTIDSVRIQFNSKNANVSVVVELDTVILAGIHKDNYVLSFDNLPTTTASINRAPLTITALNGNHLLSDGPFTGGFGVAYSGFVVGEDSTVLGGTLTYSGTSQGATDEGEFVITPQGLSSTNYEITFVSGAVNILGKPVVQTVFPAVNTTKIANNTPIYTVFSQEILADDLSLISIRDADSVAVSGVQARISADTLFLDNASLSNHKTYTVRIPEGSVKGAANDLANMEYAWSFSTIMSAPVAIRLSPANDAIRVPVNSSIQIAFDQSVTIDTEAFIVTVRDSAGIDVVLMRRTLVDTLLTVEFDAFKNRTTYTVEVNPSSVVNADGVGNAGLTWSFRTIMTAPVITGVTPANGSEDILPNGSAVVRFSQPITIADASKVSFSPSVTGLNLNAAGDSLTIAYTNLQPITTYTVTVDSGAVVNADLVSHSAYSWSFTTLVAPPTAPELVSPDSAVINQAITAITFDWNASQYAETYTMQLSDVADFSNLIEDASSISATDLFYDASLAHFTTYFWRVKAFNKVGESDWSKVYSFTTLPQAPSQTFPLMAQTEVSTAPLIQWNQSEAQAGLRAQFKLATDTTLTTLLKDTMMVASDYQSFGLTAHTRYFWSVRVNDSKGTSEWSDIRSFLTRQDPVVTEDKDVDVSFDFGSTSGTPSAPGEPEPKKTAPQQTDYRMISLPGTDAIRLDEFFTTEYKKTWRGFIETGDPLNFYDEYTKDDARFVFTPGLGFWVLSTEIVADVRKFTPVTTNANDAYAITVHPGWNIIGNPYQSNVDWNLTKEFNSKVSGQAVSGDLWGYEKAFVKTDTLKPLKGYYFYNDPTWNLSTFFLPYTGFDQRGQDQALAKELPAETPRITATATYADGKSLDVNWVFARSQDLELEINQRHPALDFAQKGMILADKTNKSVGYIRAESELVEDGVPYVLELKAQRGSTVKWKASLFNISEDTKLLLVNQVTKVSYLVGNAEELKLKITEPKSLFDVYIGSQEYLEDVRESLLPAEFTLMQNYPNPFNPSTVIRYGLKEASKVRLEVFDVLGRQVKTLVNLEQQAGWYMVDFNATGLSSGMYLYRLQSGNQVKVHKMLLVK